MRILTRGPLALVLISTLYGTSVPVARAQPGEAGTTDARAAELYESGKRHFDLAEYAAAIANWKESYLLSSEPLLLFNIGQAARLAGDCAQANRFYLNYQRVEPNPPNRTELALAMQKCVGVEPSTGDSATPPTPTGDPTTDSPRPPPPPRPEPIETPPSRDLGKRLRLIGIVVAGTGGVAGVITLMSAITARDRARTVENQLDGTTWSKGLGDTQRSGQEAETRAQVFGVIGIAAVATGGLLWWFGHQRSRARVDVAITPTDAKVGLSCAF
jgi:hypothetical protein